MRIISLIAILCVLAGCASRRFPVLPRVKELSRKEIARQQAENHYIKAKDYDRRGLFQIALQYYEKAYELDPESKILCDVLVEKYVYLKKYVKALLLVKGDRKIDDLSDEERKRVSSIYLLMQKYDQAVDAIERCASISLSDRYTLGFLYERLNNIEKAIENYSICFNNDVEYLSTGMKLASLYKKVQKYELAESLYVLLSDKYKENTEVLNNLGTINMLQNDTATALKYYQAAVEQDSTYIEAIGSMAQIHIANGDFKKAIGCYEKMILNDSLTKFYHTKTVAFLYYYDEQYDKSAEIFRSLLSSRIDEYEIYFYLGKIYVAEEKYDSAETEFKNAVNKKVDFIDAWLHLCYLFLRQKDTDKALDYALQFKDKMPDIEDSWRIYGYILNYRKEHNQAIEALQKALSFNPKNSSIWYELGGAYERTGKYVKASEAFKEALRLNPDDDVTANYLGYMWAEHNKNIDSAKVLLEFALEKDPDNGAYLDSYGWIFYRMGDLDSAEKYIKKSLESIESDPVIYDHLGDIFFEKKGYQDAIDAYKKSIELGSDKKEQLEEKIKKSREKLDILENEKNKDQREK
jgi:tetratricopeptide (TPR) repeat protein